MYERNRLERQLTKQKLLKQGAKKILFTDHVSANSRSAAKTQLETSQSKIQLIEDKLEVIERIEVNDKLNSKFIPLNEEIKLDSIKSKRRINESQLLEKLMQLSLLNEPIDQIHLACELSNIFKNELCVSIKDLLPVIYPMLLNGEYSQLRSCAYRMLRHNLNDFKHVEELFHFKQENKKKGNENNSEEFWKLELILMTSLTEDKGLEVIECVKLISKIISLNGAKILGNGVLLSLSVLAESVIAISTVSAGGSTSDVNSITSEKLEMFTLCMYLIECICELALIDPHLAFESKCLKILVSVLTDPPFLQVDNQHLSNNKGNNHSHNNNTNGNNNISHPLMSLKRIILSLPIPILQSYLSSPINRVFIEKTDLISTLLSVILDGTPNGSPLNHIQLNKLHHTAHILNLIMRSWSGLGFFLENNYHYLRILINGLYSDSSTIKNVVMGIIASTLRIQKLTLNDDKDEYNWQKLFFNEINKESLELNEFIKNKFSGRSCPEKEGIIVNQFTGIILQSLLDCEVPEILIKLYEDNYLGQGRDKDKKMAKRIILLLSEIIYLKNTLIPKELYLDTVIPFKLNSLIDKELRRHMKLNGKIFEMNKNLNSTFKINSHKSEQIKTNIVSIIEPYFNIETSSLVALSNQTTISTLIKKIKHLPDNFDIKPLIMMTHVLSTKDYKEWNWQLIHLLILAFFWNDKRFEEILKTTKFFKRLLSFYKPEKIGFVQVKYQSSGPLPGFDDVNINNNNINNVNKKRKEKDKNINLYLDVLVDFFKLLVSKTDGVKVIRNSGVLNYIKFEILRSVNIDVFFDDNASVISQDGNSFLLNDGLFSKNIMFSTLSWGYIKLIGVLSNECSGIYLLEDAGIIDLLFKLTNWDLSDEEIFISLLLKELSFNLSGQLRIFLEKFSVVTSVKFRKLATEIICQLLNSNQGSKDYTLEKWCIRCLLRQTYDKNLQVVKISLDGLNEYLDSDKHLTIFLSCRPDFTNATDLIFKVIGFECGVAYIFEHSLGLLEQLIDNWNNNQESWLLELERQYSRQLMIGGSGIGDSGDNLTAAGGIFAQLVKTDAGFRILQKYMSIKPLLDGIVNFYKMIKSNLEIENYLRLGRVELQHWINEIKRCIWTVGFLAQTDVGLDYLEGLCGEYYPVECQEISQTTPATTHDHVNMRELEIVEMLSEIVARGVNWEIKGVAIWALNMISRGGQGREILEENNIYTVAKLRAHSSTKICIGKDNCTLGSNCYYLKSTTIAEEKHAGSFGSELRSFDPELAIDDAVLEYCNAFEPIRESPEWRLLYEFYTCLSILTVNQKKGLTLLQRLKRKRLVPRLAVQRLAVVVLGSGDVRLKCGVRKFVLGELAQW
ncbi:TORC2 complex subunit [Martiniozyma asiatica (nom. inval.)]|nr:TORC2 complex subunit [Martiniozyma asiatica]